MMRMTCQRVRTTIAKRMRSHKKRLLLRRDPQDQAHLEPQVETNKNANNNEDN